MYGYIYKNTFNPSSPSSNLLTQDDDSGGNLQFLLRVPLQTSFTYVLVVTTYGQNAVAIFSITASGVGTITFNRTTIIATSPAPTLTTPRRMMTTSSM